MKNIHFLILIIYIAFLCACSEDRASDSDRGLTQAQKDFLGKDSISSIHDESQELQQIQEYLKERNLELCSFQKEKDEIATKLRKEASEKYGDIPQGLEANKAKLEYNEKRQKEEFSKLYKKYNISDSVGNLVLLLSMKYCN